MAHLDALQVRVAEGSTGGFGDDGIDIFSVVTEAGPSGPPRSGIDQALWAVVTPAGMTRFDLPPYSLPMYGNTQTLYCRFEEMRLKGLAVNYDAFFSGGLAASFAALDALSTARGASHTGILLSFTP